MSIEARKNVGKGKRAEQKADRGKENIMYYTSLEKMAERYEHTKREFAFHATSVEEHKLWKKKAAGKYQE